MEMLESEVSEVSKTLKKTVYRTDLSNAFLFAE
jgi:hypothetical protein